MAKQDDSSMALQGITKYGDTVTPGKHIPSQSLGVGGGGVGGVK